MKIIVTVKRVIDPYVKIRVKPDNSGIDTANMKMAINPFDEIAVEEALRLREAGIANEVVVVTIGQDDAQETLRQALALGADRAILLRSSMHYESLNVAKILQKLVAQEQPGLVLMGKQSIDGDNNQTPQMLAGLLNWPQATYASKIQIENQQAEVSRETDAGMETIKVELPAIISTDLRLNEPRYASLPNIMKAKSKPLQIVEVDSLGLSLKPHVEIVRVTPPTTRTGGVKVDSVASLLDKLQHEAKVL